MSHGRSLGRIGTPSHELRQQVNGHIRERLARERRIHGPTMASERLVSKGYTGAEKALAGNYGPGDVVVRSTGPTNGSASRRATSGR